MLNEDEVKLIMQVDVSLVMLGAGLWILLGAGAGPDLEKAATGWIGLVVGYWLR